MPNLFEGKNRILFPSDQPTATIDPGVPQFIFPPIIFMNDFPFLFNSYFLSPPYTKYESEASARNFTVSLTLIYNDNTPPPTPNSIFISWLFFQSCPGKAQLIGVAADERWRQHWGWKRELRGVTVWLRAMKWTAEDRIKNTVQMCVFFVVFFYFWPNNSFHAKPSPKWNKCD